MNASSTKVERLGKVFFPVSCSASEQRAFNRAVALLHSFQYAGAESAFGEIAQKDSNCAMAYWGEAMSLYHELFDWPDNPTLKRGNGYLELALKIGRKTERERAYIQAAAAFFQDDPKLDRVSRMTAYSNAMAQVHQIYPHDVEAAAFYALSLLPLEDQPGARGKAVEILEVLFAKEPDNPGVTHYLIHATDTPDLAPQGLEAARRYSKIAPSSAHALHMPSHIFSRLGFWQESISSNLASATVAAESTLSGHDNESGYQLHAMHYLLYAYLQMGRDDSAKRLIDEVRNVPGIDEADVANDGSNMKAIYIMETHAWGDAEQLTPSANTEPFAKMRIHWVRAIAECYHAKPNEAEKEVKELQDAFSTLQKNHPLASPNNALVLEGEAWLAAAQGRNEEAVKKMRTAVDADEFSVDDESVPAYELLGDLYLHLRQPASALESYEACLKEAPNRFRSLFGAGRSAELVGNKQKANTYYQLLTRIMDPGTSRSELSIAKTFLQNQQSESKPAQLN